MIFDFKFSTGMKGHIFGSETHTELWYFFTPYWPLRRVRLGPQTVKKWPIYGKVWFPSSSNLERFMEFWCGDEVFPITVLLQSPSLSFFVHYGLLPSIVAFLNPLLSIIVSFGLIRSIKVPENLHYGPLRSPLWFVTAHHCLLRSVMVHYGLC